MRNDLEHCETGVAVLCVWLPDASYRSCISAWSTKHADTTVTAVCLPAPTQTRRIGCCLRWHTAKRWHARPAVAAACSGHDRALELNAARDQIQVTLSL